MMSGGGIVVEVVTDQYLNKILSNSMLQSEGYDVKNAGATKPRILLYEVLS